MDTISNQTCTKCQNCGKWTNYAGDEQHVARMERLARYERALNENADKIADALPKFDAWLAREMPPGTIISDPHWWARKILRVALAEHDAQPAQAAQPKTLAIFTANQAQMLLDSFGGSPTAYALIACKEGECAPLDDGSPSPAGLYVYDLNCPEEGVIYLGDEDEDSEPRAEQAAQPVGEIIGVTGSVGEMRVVRWRDRYSPEVGTKLYAAPQPPAQPSADAEDAARYRYWREHHGWSGYFDDGLTNSEDADDIDRALDAARAAEGGNE